MCFTNPLRKLKEIGVTLTTTLSACHLIMRWDEFLSLALFFVESGFNFCPLFSEDHDELSQSKMPRYEPRPKPTRPPSRLSTESVILKKEVLDRLKLLFSLKPESGCKNCDAQFNNNLQLFEHMKTEHQVSETVPANLKVSKKLH